MSPIRGGPTLQNPAVKLAETSPEADLAPRERAIWLRLAPIADQRARAKAEGGTCIRSDLFGWRHLCRTVAFCELVAASDVPRIDPGQAADVAKLKEEALATFYLTPTDALVN
jgi:hypothetical protein